MRPEDTETIKTAAILRYRKGRMKLPGKRINPGSPYFSPSLGVDKSRSRP